MLHDEDRLEVCILVKSANARFLQGNPMTYANPRANMPTALIFWEKFQ